MIYRILIKKVSVVGNIVPDYLNKHLLG